MKPDTNEVPWGFGLTLVACGIWEIQILWRLEDAKNHPLIAVAVLGGLTLGAGLILCAVAWVQHDEKEDKKP